MKRVAAVQMASGPNVDANLIEARRHLNAAASAGAKLVVLPENFALMGNTDADLLKIMEDEGNGKIQKFLSETAAKLGIWIVGGTVPLKTSDAKKVRAACLVFDDKGKQVARYDKIHLFDVEIEETNENYNESKTIEAGEEIVVIDSPVGRLGIAICYDIRFPELFRKMLDLNVEIFAIPSAFTAITGRAHWKPLVRTRAIENLCYVIAAAQGGYHVSGRETHGDSMIVDPWGNMLDRLKRGSGVVVGDIDEAHIKSIRSHFPSITHRKL